MVAQPSKAGQHIVSRDRLLELMRRVMALPRETKGGSTLTKMSHTAEQDYRRMRQDVEHDVLDTLIEHGLMFVQDLSQCTRQPVARVYSVLIALQAKGYVCTEGRDKVRKKPFWTVTNAGRVYAITPTGGIGGDER